VHCSVSCISARWTGVDDLVTLLACRSSDWLNSQIKLRKEMKSTD